MGAARESGLGLGHHERCPGGVLAEFSRERRKSAAWRSITSTAWARPFSARRLSPKAAARRGRQRLNGATGDGVHSASLRDEDNASPLLVGLCP